MWNLRLVDSTPSPDPYRLPGPKAIVVGIDASRVGLGILLSILREDGTQWDAEICWDVLHLQTTIKNAAEKQLRDINAEVAG